MEVSESAQKTNLMREYPEKHHRQAYLVIVASACGASVVIVGMLLLCQVLVVFSWQFWLILIMTSAFLTLTGIGVFTFLTKPFKALVQATILVTGTPNGKTPPNPNDYHDTDEGLKLIIQSLYELTSKPEPVIKQAVQADDELRAGLDQTPSGIVILDSDQNIIYNNKNAPIHIDRQGDKAINVLFPDADTLSQWITECHDKAVHAEHIWTRVADKGAGEQDRRIYDIVASYQKDHAAETVITFFDRSSTYAPEEDDLDFISFAAHELRGPITVIRGYLDVIDEELGPSLENDQKELMQRLIVSANRLSSYINNILNASRYDRRHFKIRLSEEHLSSIYETISDDMQLRAISQHRSLTVDIPESLPTIAADRNSIGEVLSNLIDNAIKYSNEGGQVIVKARAVSGHIEVFVVDRGIGMPASVIPNLFHKFYRSHRSRETVAGTGIGLYLSKAIVESHGGSIEVRSTESEGSTFSFTLPIYSTVAEKIKAGNNSNELLIVHGGGWIRNHSLYRG